MENLVKNTVVTLKKGEGRSLKAGGAWIYDNEIESIVGTFKNGEIVRVHDFDGFPMGAGFINQNSKIRVRMLTRAKDPVVDGAFLSARVKAAWEYRKAVMPAADLNCCRIIFGEADFLPGLVIDKYSDVLVVECLALGMEPLKELIIDSLKDFLRADGFEIRGVYERSDAPVLKKEGLLPHKGFIGPEFDTNVEIVENGVKYLVDVVNGQKTGFFLDQKYNRLAMQRVISGLAGFRESVRVLDCFTHMGTFALNCGLAGATNVTGLDISEFAVAQAAANAKRNGLEESVRFRAANVLDELPKLCEQGELYDVVILDPPAFTKSKDATKNAIKGYREINMKGLKLVKDGGFLATCSCSHFMTQELFTEVIGQAAKAVHKRLSQVEFRTQAPDHPILWAADESYYLKFYIFRVSDEK
ncbi:MAG: class I SAM-dependent rRNA methyltransferase [Lachnospiraceae bacterium]|nr:class I SAM-dependent rRNA methyltransferase [Lachnospiraceae bacterium]